ncbi:DUF4189 domain-containing protein [Xanthomonas cucurbitae]|nr:DUF4189 domain-containing protein [Xanthomonas cucurbitae]
MNKYMKNNFLVVFALLMGAASHNAHAEQGCPPGQYPIGGQGVVACAPIPQDNPIQQAPRPSGKWLKTWGAIASDGGDNLGVSKGKLKKKEAQEEALEKCRSVSGKECAIDFIYENQCASIAEPYLGERAVTGMLAYARGPSKESATSDVISRCLKDNEGSECRVIYNACSEPIFQPY